VKEGSAGGSRSRQAAVQAGRMVRQGVAVAGAGRREGRRCEVLACAQCCRCGKVSMCGSPPEAAGRRTGRKGQAGRR